MRHLTLLLLGLCAAASCKSSDKKSTRSVDPKTEVVPVTAPDPVPVGNDKAAIALGPPTFEVDGKAIEVGEISDDVELLSINALPAIAQWATIIARSQDGREFRGSKPILLTGTRTMKLVKLPSGYEFRVMDHNESGPYIRHKMSALRRIIVLTKDYQPPPVPVPSLVVKSDKSESTISSEMMDALPKSAEPNGEAQRDTWKLVDLLSRHGGPEASAVAMSNPGGQELTLTQAELVDPGWLHMIKRNRRGEFNYRGWKLSEPASKERELRGVSHIELR